jgi:hypothetical protein
MHLAASAFVDMTGSLVPQAVVPIGQLYSLYSPRRLFA